MYVPKSKRKLAPLSSNDVKTAPTQLILKGSLTNTVKREVKQHYSAEKPTTYRNITPIHWEDWSTHEDTAVKYDTSYLSVNPEKESSAYEICRPTHYGSGDNQENNCSNDDINYLNKDPSAWTSRDCRIWRSDHQVILQSAKRLHAPPLLHWDSSGVLSSNLVHILQSHGFSEPFPIQSLAIPLVLGSFGTPHDLIGLTQPGKGKTLAYVVPMIATVMNSSFDSTLGPLCVVLAPTHDLANQISTVISTIGAPLGINSKVVIAGQEHAMLQSVQMQAPIVVATPGRLSDMIVNHLIVLGQCKMLVLDEADKMMDKSFNEHIHTIISATPRERRIMMFSATMPHEVLSQIDDLMRDQVKITVGQLSDASESVRQVIRYVKIGEKRQKLIELLHSLSKEFPVIVFTNTRASCDDIACLISDAGFRCAALSGSRTQDERDSVLLAMQTGAIEIVIATDVIARGIDIQDIRHVINYEMPSTLGTYLHRIGRTGRAGKEGVATSFITDDDTNIMFDLRKMLERSGYSVPHELLNNPASQARPEPK